MNDYPDDNKSYPDSEAFLDDVRDAAAEANGDTDVLAQVKELLEQAASAQDEINRLELELKPWEARLNATKLEIQSIFEMMDIDELSANGYKFSLKTESSVKVPKTVEEKTEFFQYLEKEGLFYEVVGVNSMTLNKFYKEKAAEALEQGNIDFRLPGIETPKEYNVLKIKKGK